MVQAKHGGGKPSAELLADPGLARQVRRKALELVGRAGFGPGNVEDLEQEMWLDLVRAMRRYDPAQGRVQAYASGVLEIAARRLVRERVGNGRLRTVSQSIPVHDGDGGITDLGSVLTREAPQDIEQADLAIDMEAVMNRLPPDLRAVCGKLKEKCPAQAARELGLSLWHFQRKVDRIRRIFEAAGLGDCP